MIAQINRRKNDCATGNQKPLESRFVKAPGIVEYQQSQFRMPAWETVPGDAFGFIKGCANCLEQKNPGKRLCLLVCENKSWSYGWHRQVAQIGCQKPQHQNHDPEMEFDQ